MDSRVAQDVAPFFDILAAPGGQPNLELRENSLVTTDGSSRYPISASGIPLFAVSSLSQEADFQQKHYDEIAELYVTNLSYPHTQEYMAYLDRVLLEAVGTRNNGVTVELCCGHGEALKLGGVTMERYVGIDISEKMLEAANSHEKRLPILLVQADVTKIPLKAASVDTVMMLGGIHHIPDRAALFKEVARILKPGGRLIFREPASDFILWRALRAIIYRLSPMLDHATEQPLLYSETEPVLRKAGLSLTRYRSCGFLGFCVFMNSDVLVFNRLFRFVPGIRAITRLSTYLDEALLRLPGLRRGGLQVVGVAERGNS